MMASSTTARPTSSDSKLIRYTQIDAKDSTDIYLECCFNAIQQNRYTMDSNQLLQIAENNKKNKDSISNGLLYGILIDANNGAKYFQDLLLLNGTNLASVISKLELLIMTNWRRIHDHVRERSIWFLRKTLAANIDGIDRLYYAFLRLINPVESSLDLCETILELLLANPNFLKTYPEMMLLTMYSFLAISPIYVRRRSSNRYWDFVLGLMRENLHCIGRDGIRLLIQSGNVPEVDQFFKHTASTASADYLPKILAIRTEPKYLALPLSLEMEKQVQHIFDHCRVNSQEMYYLDWFQSQHLNFKKNPDSIHLCSHIIRYVCVVCRNQLTTNKISRWAFVSWIMNHLISYQQAVQQSLISASQTAVNAAAIISSSSPQLIQINEQIVQCRLAIFYDWFMFDQNQLLNLNSNDFDFQLNSEMVGYHILKDPYLLPKQMLLFLYHTSENFIVSLKPVIQQNIARLFFELFQRIPIMNSQQLLMMFLHDRDIHSRLKSTFFSLPLQPFNQMMTTNDAVMMNNDDISPNAAMPSTGNDAFQETEDTLMLTNSASRFSDDEDDDDGQYNSMKRSPTADQGCDDDDILLISDETKQSADIYNISVVQENFPFEQFRSLINEHTQNLVLSYSTCANQSKTVLLTQIYKSIASHMNDRCPLAIIEPTDPPGPISSYAMSKLERSSEKFQSRLLSMFDESTIAHGLVCLWLLRENFFNRYLPSIRVYSTSVGSELNSNLDETSRELSPQRLKRSIKNLPICVLFRLIRDDRTHQEAYNKLLQAMFFFQSELAWIYLYYLSIEVNDNRLASELFEKFANRIIKLSTNYRKLAIPPAKMLSYDQDFVDFLHEVLSQCEQDDTETFLYIFSYVYRIFREKLFNNSKIIRLLLHSINQSELEQFMCDILKHQLQLFHAHKLYSTVDQTLVYTQQEQEYFWQLLAAHDFVQNDYEQLFTNIIEHLLNPSKSVLGEQRLLKSASFTKLGNTIALSNVYDILQGKQPTYGLVCCLFAHPLTKNFSEKLCLLWNDRHHDLFWRHLERILQKWFQRENDSTEQKIDYKIGTIKMARDQGLQHIVQHLQVIFQYRSNTKNFIKPDQNVAKEKSMNENTRMEIPLSKTTIKSLIEFVRKDEQLYAEKKQFVDQLEKGNSVLSAGTGSTTQPSATVTTSSTSVKRRKLDNQKS